MAKTHPLEVKGIYIYIYIYIYIVVKIVYIMDLTSFGTLLYFARRSNIFLKLQFTHLKLFKSLKMDKNLKKL
jgi:hypothetical protein